MKRLLSRAATFAVALPLALGATTGAAQAYETVTVAGCWGGGVPAAVVCNLTVTVGEPVGTAPYTVNVPVCTGTCQNVPVSIVTVTSGDPVSVCYTYKDGNGVTHGDCVDGGDLDPWVDFAYDLALQAVAIALDVACNSTDWISCN